MPWSSCQRQKFQQFRPSECTLLEQQKVVAVDEQSIRRVPFQKKKNQQIKQRFFQTFLAHKSKAICFPSPPDDPVTRILFPSNSIGTDRNAARLPYSMKAGKTTSNDNTATKPSIFRPEKKPFIPK
jgi:hypothetical protein